MLKFAHVTFVVPSQEKPILKGLDFTLQPKEFVLILGANGSGKSSLLKLMSGEYQAPNGKVTNEARSLAYLSQDTSQTLFHDLTVLENCCLNEQKVNPSLFKISPESEQRAYSFYLKDFHPHMPHKMATEVSKLSGGERQSLALGLVLIQDPDFLLLDEHTSALDPKIASALMELTNQEIRNRGLTAVMVTHNIQHALTYGTRIMALKDGEIVLDVQGTEKQRLQKKDLMTIYS